MITFEAKELTKALTSMVSVLDIKTTMPALRNIAIESKDGTATLIGTNLENTIVVQMPAKGNDHIGVEGRKLLALVGSVDGEVSLTADDKDWVSVKMPNGKARIPGVGVSQLPESPDMDFSTGAKLKVSMLKDALHFAGFSAERIDKGFTYESHALLKFANNQLEIASTNARLLSVATIDCEYTNEVEVTIPSSCLPLLIRTLSTAESEDLTILLHVNLMGVSIGATKLFLRLSAAKLPNYHLVVDAEYLILLKADVTELRKAHTALIGFLPEERVDTIEWQISKETLTLSRVQQTASGEFTVPVIADAEFETAYQGRYLMEILKRLSGNVTFCFRKGIDTNKIENYMLRANVEDNGVKASMILASNRSARQIAKTKKAGESK